jgi:mannose-6-phosphate isomerase-like protein (cupin superfamily)
MKLKKPKVVDKPWGREIWIAQEKEYAGKILEIKKGFHTSLHYHDEKKETMYILEGTLRVLHHDGENTLKEGQSITLDPRDVHRLFAVTDVKILEVSTPHLKDVVRVMDDYGRA